MTTMSAQRKGHQPVRRSNAQAKRNSALRIISRYLPDITLIAVGVLAVGIMAVVYPQVINITTVSAMGGIFIASGLLGLLR